MNNLINDKDINIEVIFLGFKLSTVFNGEYYSQSYYNCDLSNAIEHFKNYVEEQEFNLLNFFDDWEEDDD